MGCVERIITNKPLASIFCFWELWLRVLLLIRKGVDMYGLW